jgi:LmbE family N-acetylglucosaminyl deacetylase
MASICEITPGAGRVVLVVVAHADDMALFLGGTVARWCDAGWRVVLVRVTDDRWDSVALSEADTIAANARELRAAAAILGVHEIVDLGYPTDVLGDTSAVALREKIIRQVRRWRPYALVGFDPYSGVGEDNQDHLVVAKAVDEAFWTAQFDKHHPEHLADGLAPHGAFERWYFGRPVREVTDVVDISATLERKLAAARAHDTPLRNAVEQLRMQARTGGWQVAALDEARSGDLGPLLEVLVRGAAERAGERHGVRCAEEFRVVRFGGLAPLLEAIGRRV